MRKQNVSNTMNKNTNLKRLDIIKEILPCMSILLTLLLQVSIPDSGKHPQADVPYFTYALFLALVVWAVTFGISFMNKNVQKKLVFKGYFIAGAIFFLNVINLLTVKFTLLPVLYFPSLDRIFGVLVTDRQLIIKCLLYSARLLLVGFFSGAIVGILCGIAIGFSKTVSYWLMPIVRVLGPIPSTAWIPLVLVCFPSAVSASTFLIAVAVWFPTTIMTSSGISNVQNSYFEVSSTLGANRFAQIFRVGVPAAMPHMFLGLFNGTSASFITLITAEMIGAKYGIGWYVNWQKELLAYANVYAGLIVIAVVFSILTTLLFKVRDKVLLWQKGVIKW